MNLRPLGYEPNELPDCSTPRQLFLINISIVLRQYFVKPMALFLVPADHLCYLYPMKVQKGAYYEPDIKTKRTERSWHLCISCGLYEVFDNAPWEGVKHHWHDEIEILYFMKGNFKVKINIESFPVEEECFFFVNPGEIHSVDCSALPQSLPLFFIPAS